MTFPRKKLIYKHTRRRRHRQIIKGCYRKYRATELNTCCKIEGNDKLGTCIKREGLVKQNYKTSKPNWMGERKYMIHTELIVAY